MRFTKLTPAEMGTKEATSIIIYKSSYDRPTVMPLLLETIRQQLDTYTIDQHTTSRVILTFAIPYTPASSNHILSTMQRFRYNITGNR